MLTLHLANVVNAADVRVGDLPRDADLGIETLEARGVVREHPWKKLQRDRLAELQVIGAIDLAHSAAAQKADNPIPLRQDRSGGESARVDRVRGGEPANGR